MASFLRGELASKATRMQSKPPINTRRNGLQKKITTAKESEHFSFATVHLPMDTILNIHCKVKNDHRGTYKNEKGGNPSLASSRIEQVEAFHVQDLDARGFFDSIKIRTMLCS